MRHFSEMRKKTFLNLNYENLENFLLELVKNKV